jgi:hypothetical protein
LKLTIDRRDQLHGEPCVHALIVGVSEYGPVLPPATAQPPPLDSPSFGMRSLTAPAASAAAVFKWLIGQEDAARGDHLAKPLGTCRLLLAPSSAESKRLNLSSRHPWSKATRASFADAAADWRKAASERPGHVAFFYFAGHGLQLKYDRQVLLFPGFGKADDTTPILSEGVLLDDILSGMGPSKDRDQIAKTQLYFIDACRNRVEPFDTQETNNVPPLWKTPKVTTDYRHIVVFRATAYGSEAYSIPNDLTVFGRALVDCLSGLAGVDDAGEYDPATQDSIWVVTANSLSQALHYRISRLSDEYGLPSQQVNPAGNLANVLIARLPKAPLFPVTLRAMPSGADKLANVAVYNDYGECVQSFVQPFEKHPIQTEFLGGVYKVDTLANSLSIHPGCKKLMVSKSPSMEWRIRFVMPHGSP